MCHFSGEVNEINDSLTVLSDGCLCMSAFVFGAGFQADPIRVLLWLHMVEHLQQHTKHRKRLREKRRISVGFLIRH